MGGMDLWVSYSLAFKRLDDYINQVRSNQDLDALMAQFDTPHPAFPGPGVPDAISLPPGSQSHFAEHWIGNPPASGGTYWPYLKDIDVGKMLQCAFETSVRIFATARKKREGHLPTKFHATLWTCAEPVPPGYLDHPGTFTMLKDEQERVFRIAVIELDYVVEVLISTPGPDPTALAEEYDELDVAYLVPHYRLESLFAGAPSCGWIQYAHPLKEQWARTPNDLAAYGQRPKQRRFELTVPGDRRIDETWTEEE
jgi:hypothetical protein